MFGLFRRRSQSRQAQAAEARGDVEEAARLWGLAGDRGKVGLCWVRIAERALSDEARVDALRTAVDHLRGAGAGFGDALRDAEVGLARILVARADLHGVTGARERELVAEAAGILERRGETLAAGEAWEKLGRVEDAARAYQVGGHVEALERVLGEDVARTSAARKVERRYDEYLEALASGARDRALEAIRACASQGPATGGYADLVRELEGRFPRPGRVLLSLGSELREIVGGEDGVVLGRSEGQVALRNLDVSRRHTELEPEGDAWKVRDLGSRSGTTLDGLALGGAVPLPPRGRLGLGPSVVIAFEVVGPHVELRIEEGLDRGRWVTVTRGPLQLEGTGRSLAFRTGYAVLQGGSEVRLAGARTTDEVVLLVGDVVDAAERRIEVKE